MRLEVFFFLACGEKFSRCLSAAINFWWDIITTSIEYSELDAKSIYSEASRITKDTDALEIVKNAVTLADIIKQNLCHDLSTLLKLIWTDRFSVNNLDLRLFPDVTRWYSLNSTRQMTYPEDTKLFWKVGYTLIHGKFLRLMSGEKLEWELIQKATEGF